MDSAQSNPSVFVLMPVRVSWNDVFRYGALEPCQQLGAHCERLGEHLNVEGALDRLHHKVASADLIVADLSGLDREVFYPLGYALALGKQVLLLAQDEDAIPADLSYLPHVIYRGATELADAVQQRIAWCLEHAEPLARAEPDLRLYACGVELRDEMAVECHLEEGRYLLEIGLKNRGQVASLPGVQLSLETEDEMAWSSPGMQSRGLPDTHWLYQLPASEAILPGAWDVHTLQFDERAEPGRHRIALNLHLPLATRRYRLELKLPVR